MGKIILGVLVGFFVTALLSIATDEVFIALGMLPQHGQPLVETNILIVATIYRAIFQVFGAYLACTIAKDKAKTTVWAIGILGTILWLVGTFANADMSPLWYGIIGAVLSIPTVLVGLNLYNRRNKPQP